MASTSLKQIMDQIAAGGGATAGERPPLGVAPDYKAQQPFQYSVQGQAHRGLEAANVERTGINFVAPLYHQGDELLPFIEDPSSGNRQYITAPEDIAALQNKMVAIGLIRPGQKFIHGQFDDTTQLAYKEILEQANKKGLDWQSAMSAFQPGELMGVNKAGKAVAVGEGGGPTRLPFSPQLTPREDLAATYKAVAQKHLGRDPTPIEIDNFTKSFGQTELSRQQAAYNAQTAGGATPAPATPSAAAEEQLTKVGSQLGAETGAHNIATTFDNFLGLLKGPVGQV